jgi:hypothetical protein
MEPSATNILAGKLDGLPGGPVAVLYSGAPDQLVFANGEALRTESVPLAGQQGYYCAFKPMFMPEKLSNRIKRLSLFANPGESVVDLNPVQASAVGRIFELLVAEMGSKYRYKLDLMRTYVIQIIHFGLKNADRGS